MRLGVILAALVGLAVATAIVGYIGFGAVFAALSAIGWRGLGFLIGYSAVPFFLLGTAWFVLDGAAPLAKWAAFIAARVVRDSAGEILPFSHLGGFVIGARAAIVQGVPATMASSTTVVDVTTELIAQLGFTGLGLALLAFRLGSRSSHDALAVAALVGLGLLSAGAVAFIVVQRRGGPLVGRLVARFLPGAAAQAGEIGRALDALYANPWRIAAAVGVHLAAWIASAVGVWLALRLARVEIALASVLAIESLVGAVRSAAFVAPMGIGVQEATYALIGPVFGLGPDLSLAVSLLKRARDLAIGIPALLAWQAVEGLRAVGGGGRRDDGAPSGV